MRTLLVAAVLSLTLASGSLGQTPEVDPRAAVEQIATRIEQRFYDPARASRIAGALRAETAAGRYDALRDPRDLATALTTRLQPDDRHFAVSWRALAEAAPGPGGPTRDLGREARSNHGFRRVEMLPGGVGYLELRQFAHFEGADEPARRTADAALAFLAGADALVVDLRDNGGGSPAMVGYLVAAFTPEGADVFNTFHSRDGVEDERPPHQPLMRRTDTPLFVLISGRTGSAAESFAYTLQAAGRAVVVGEVSGGAANPGGPVDAGGGFSVFVSQGSPVNPITGRNWEGTGVRPDVPVPQENALTRAHALALEAVSSGRPAEAAPDALRVLETLRTGPVNAPLADYAGDYGEVAVVATAEGLALNRGRRPPRRLRALRVDTFYDVDDPSARVVFERNEAGLVIALDQRGADGGGVRRLRTVTPGRTPARPGG